jgi:hypothetical protein
VAEKIKRKFLVLVTDQVARDVVVEATTAEEALEKANMGEWELPAKQPGSGDVVSEEVVHRQAEEILEEDYKEDE